MAPGRPEGKIVAAGKRLFLQQMSEAGKVRGGGRLENFTHGLTDLVHRNDRGDAESQSQQHGQSAPRCPRQEP